MPERRRGAVRSEAARMAILEATARQFGLRGYDHLTVEGIAADAGVGKQTIYRWWPSKGALVAECMVEGVLLPDRPLVPHTGDVRADLVSWLSGIGALAHQPGGEGLMRSLISAAAENAEVGLRLNESLGATSSLVERLAAAVDDGQLRSDAALQEIGDALLGAVVLRALSGSPIDADAAERLVDVVLDRPSAGGR